MPRYAKKIGKNRSKNNFSSIWKEFATQIDSFHFRFRSKEAYVCSMEKKSKNLVYHFPLFNFGRCVQNRCPREFSGSVAELHFEVKLEFFFEKVSHLSSVGFVAFRRFLSYRSPDVESRIFEIIK